MEVITNWISQYGCLAIFALLMLGIVGLPVPDEILLTFIGYMIFEDILRPLPAATAAFLGSLCGITLSYILGCSFGLPLIEKYGRFLNLKVKHLDKVNQWFKRIGKWTLTIGYFLPWVRHFTGFVAGTSKLKFTIFASYAYLGALLWATTFISLGYFLGGQWPVISAQLLDSGHIHMILLLEVGGILILFLVAGYFFLRQRVSLAGTTSPKSKSPR